MDKLSRRLSCVVNALVEATPIYWPGLETGATSNYLYIPYSVEDGPCPYAESLLQNAGRTYSTIEGVLNYLWLLMYLLEHEEFVFPLLRRLGFILNGRDRPSYFFTSVPHLYGIQSNLGGIALFEINESVGYLSECQWV